MNSKNAIAGSWSSLPISLTPWILDVVEAMGHTQMTPVQASTIPLFMRNKDVVVEAVTGSGKTLAFVIPVLERLIRREKRLKANEIGALIISPTRELSNQLHYVLNVFLASQPRQPRSTGADESSADMDTTLLNSLLLVSSDQSSPLDDIQRFIDTRADIVIGTPGRIEEFLLGRGKSSVSVKELEVLVLDEADRLLDLGFQASITRILTSLPKQRRTGLFSATMTDADALSELVRISLRNPSRVVVRVQSKTTVLGGQSKLIEERRLPANLENYYITCRTAEKLVQTTRIISREIQHNNSSRFIIYLSTCACVDYFFRIIRNFLQPKTNLFSLHGHLPPAARTKTLLSFSNSLANPSSPSILLATDVAARGLDLPNVDVVIQFDPPSDPKAFSHRCGRTARAGRSGRAYVLLCGREEEYVDFMAIRKIPMKRQPYIDDALAPDSTVDRLLDTSVEEFLSQIRAIILSDRGLSEKGTKAFVSFVKSYSKHEASYIFRMKDFDLVGLAICFGLLRLPRMPELKGRDITRWKDANIDLDNFSYADPAQEAKRLASAEVKLTSRDRVLENEKSTPQLHRKLSTAWSQQTQKREERERRREKKSRKKDWSKSQSVGSVTPNTKRPRDSGEDDEDPDDWKEIAREEQLAKKLRRGQVNQQAFDREFCNL